MTYLCSAIEAPYHTMKKIHIVLLVLIAAAIAVLITFLQDTSTYDTVDTAIARPGKFVHLMASVDKREPVEYDALKNPNYLSFTAIDTLGKTIRVVYNKPKPENFDNSEKLVLQGKYINGLFECRSIQTKCPSKYNDQPGAAEKNIQRTTQQNTAENGSANL